MSRPRPSHTLLAFLFAGSLVGLLTMQIGLLVGHAQSEGAQVIECAPFPLELERQSTSEFRLTSPTGQEVVLEMDFLEIAGDIIATRHVELMAGAMTAFSMPTRYVGSAIQAIASAPVQVDVTLAYDGSVGAAERKAVPCTLIFQQPVRGWLYPPVALPGR